MSAPCIVQYSAHDKLLSGVAGDRTVSEAVAIAASAGGESGTKVKLVTADLSQKLDERSAVSAHLGRGH